MTKPLDTAPKSTLACSTTRLSVAYRETPVLSHVSLHVPRGVLLGIVGPNGAGKSTLIKTILGLVQPLSGKVEFFGGQLSEQRHRIAYMPQATSVDWDFPATVHDVVVMGTYASLGWMRRPRRTERERAHRALEDVGISHLASRHIGELSGGERQRVFLARTLVQSPELIFMDEPLQGVDATSEQAILAVLRSLRHAGTTIVMVHHDLATVRQYCDHVALLNRTLIASGPTSEVLTREHVREAYNADVQHLGFAQDQS